MARTVLIVEDEATIALALSHLMKGMGHEVQTAGTGEEALKAASECSPDLVLLDLGLPDISGFEVCQRLRSDGRMNGVRVAVLSATNGPGTAEKARALGADCLIAKPFGCAALREQVATLLADGAAPDG